MAGRSATEGRARDERLTLDVRRNHRWPSGGAARRSPQDQQRLGGHVSSAIERKEFQ